MIMLEMIVIMIIIKNYNDEKSNYITYYNNDKKVL